MYPPEPYALLGISTRFSPISGESWLKGFELCILGYDLTGRQLYLEVLEPALYLCAHDPHHHILFSFHS